MQWRFFLDELEIDEPVGWADLELSMNRDDTYHGMQFEVSTGTLRFFGAAANYLIDKKETNAIFNNVVFKAEQTCEENNYTELVEGRLNFGKYKATCGTLCLVEIPFEEEGCKVTFKNRFDQKVDLDSLFAYDNATVLPDYAQLGKKIRIPAKALQAAVDGSVGADGYENISTHADVAGGLLLVRPEYDVERYNNIKTGQLTGGNNCEDNSGSAECFGPITPQLLFEDLIQCFDGNYDYNIRMKGEVEIGANVNLFHIKHKIVKWDGVGNIFDDAVIVQEATLFDGLPSPPPGPLTQAFDNTFTGTTTIADGIGFYSYIEVGYTTSGGGDITVRFTDDTFFTLEAIKICPDTQADYYMVHEALSRVAESITNKCLRVKSAYYGRTDSQPFSFDEDGCGSLRMFTGGLKLRNAPDGHFFASAKDLISGLNAIDNIGFEITDDPKITGRFILRIEPVAEFYQDTEILRLESISESVNELQESLHYAKILAGYKKWEVEQVNGLNEFNSTREYRTNADTISTTLDIQSSLIAGSYPIEVTRQQSFAETGAQDTTYDDETFIICLIRNAYDFAIEQGKILNDSNIFDPATVMNYRISPIRNLLRWFKSIINTYPNITSSNSRLFFNAGTANFLAAGLLDDAAACRLENNTIAENANLSLLNFTNQAQGTPLFKNETDTFDYPLSIGQYNKLKANPYGYIAHTCGQSSTLKKGFIKEVKFRPARGMANFTLRKKWEA